MHAATHACRILSNCQEQLYGVEHIDDCQHTVHVNLGSTLYRDTSVLCLARSPDSCGMYNH